MTIKTAKKITATSRISTTKLAADPDLTINALAASQYHFKAIVHWSGQGSTANGIKAQINASSGIVRSSIAIANANSFMANSSPTANELTATGVAFSKLPNSPGTTETIVLEGVIETINAGTIFLEWAQAASVAINTRVDIGSCLIITKL